MAQAVVFESKRVVLLILNFTTFHLSFNYTEKAIEKKIGITYCKQSACICIRDYIVAGAASWKLSLKAGPV